jgi:hypothetical protein
LHNKESHLPSQYQEEEPSPIYDHSYSCLGPNLQKSIFKIEAQEKESSPIYDHSYSSPHQQYQEEPHPRKSFALEKAMSAFLSHNKEYNHQLQSTMAKMEAHLKKIS